VARENNNFAHSFAKACALVASILMLAAANVVAREIRLESLAVDGVTYSNVTVVGTTATHIEFKHAHGFSSVKAKMLPEDLQIKLGYTPPPPPKQPLKDLGRNIRNMSNFREDPRYKEIEAFVRSETERLMTSDPQTVKAILGGVICIYLLFCSAVALICRKTTTRPGLWVWIPGFQFVSLFKAAGMPAWNLLLLLVPVVNIVVTIIWCFRIARVRQKSSVWGFLLLIPIVNILAFFYLAFSSAPKAPPIQREKVRLSFQTSPARS
jgi:hypothetical protein